MVSSTVSYYMPLFLQPDLIVKNIWFTYKAKLKRILDFRIDPAKHFLEGVYDHFTGNAPFKSKLNIARKRKHYELPSLCVRLFFYSMEHEIIAIKKTLGSFLNPNSGVDL